MTPHVVADIGNTRIKWGLCAADAATVGRVASLDDDPEVWQRQRDDWRAELALAGPLSWVLASVQPKRCERLRDWLEAHGDSVRVLTKAEQLPLRIGLAEPNKVGIDRLLNAVAALEQLEAGRPAVLIDAGSAVTLDWLDEEHIFQGGAIYPGLDLMAQALNSYTALLPRVSVKLPVPELPGQGTIAAMQVGIFLAVSGGIREAVRLYAQGAKQPPRVFFSGGQAPLLARAMGLVDGAALPPPWTDYLLWPEQTLVGILQSARGLA